MAERRWRAAYWALFGSLLLAKLWLAATLPLFGDEAFYWLESRSPAAANDDVPGLTPWLIAAGRWLFGESRLALRLPFLAIAALTAWYLVRMATAAFGARAGWQAGLVALLLPLFAINGVLALPDVPLTLAILLCAEALRRLQESAGAVGQRLLAAGLALGWLSHYRFVIAVAAGAAWLLLDRDARRLLQRPALWLAALAGSAAGLAPLLWQQGRTGGHGLLFQFSERHPWQFHGEGLADPLLQAAVVTPGLFLLLLAAAVVAWRRGAAWPTRGWSGPATLLLLGLMALGPIVDAERSRLHWPLPAWLLLALLLPAVLRGRSLAMRRVAAAAAGLAGLGVVLAFGYLGLVAHAPARLAASGVYPHNFAGWDAAAAAVAAELRDAPADTVLAADNFMLAAQLSFALGGRAVYSLDHPLNQKHGRQAELGRRGRDEQALRRAAAGRPLLLVLEEGATRLRQRPAWFRSVCERFPAARARFDLLVDRRKRFIGYLQPAADGGGCVPPALAYLHRPSFDEPLAGTLPVAGWAIRDRAGIERLWLAIDGVRVAELPVHAEPGVRMQFPGSDDPRHPGVGFRGRFEPDLAPGRHWLTIEAESADGPIASVASVPFRWTVPAR